MGRIFGTDGVRGIANESLTIERAVGLAQAAGMLIRREKDDGRPLFLVGRDTRLSGTMLESAVAAGLCAVGADVALLGVVPTPAVAYLVKALGADAGVMLTASHNPFAYNGVKFFGPDGFKLMDERESEIESIVLDHSEPVVFAKAEEIGAVHAAYDYVEKYVEHLVGSVGRLSGLRIAVDCANGSAAATARRIFDAAGARAVYIGCEPDGCNVNRDCGSLHIEALGDFVRAGGYDLGVAFDGDADRCLAVDENGGLIDGDRILAMLARRLDDQGRLAHNTFVATVMSNLGLFRFAEKHGYRCMTTKVGDRYVLETMLRGGFVLGGEQSGHIIWLERMTTGDGQLTALLLAETLLLSGRRASQLAKVMDVYPQVMLNIDATPEMKEHLKDPEVKSFLDIQTECLAGDGRILVRPSGTEPLVRIMVEGRDGRQIRQLAEECAATLSLMLLQ